MTIIDQINESGGISSASDSSDDSHGDNHSGTYRYRLSDNVVKNKMTKEDVAIVVSISSLFVGLVRLSNN